MEEMFGKQLGLPGTGNSSGGDSKQINDGGKISQAQFYAAVMEEEQPRLEENEVDGCWRLSDHAISIYERRDDGFFRIGEH